MFIGRRNSKDELQLKSKTKKRNQSLVAMIKSEIDTLWKGDGMAHSGTIGRLKDGVGNVKGQGSDDAGGEGLGIRRTKDRSESGHKGRLFESGVEDCLSNAAEIKLNERTYTERGQ